MIALVLDFRTQTKEHYKLTFVMLNPRFKFADKCFLITLLLVMFIIQ